MTALLVLPISLFVLLVLLTLQAFLPCTAALVSWRSKASWEIFESNVGIDLVPDNIDFQHQSSFLARCSRRGTQALLLNE